MALEDGGGPPGPTIESIWYGEETLTIGNPLGGQVDFNIVAPTSPGWAISYQKQSNTEVKVWASCDDSEFDPNVLPLTINVLATHYNTGFLIQHNIDIKELGVYYP